ncbi:MAG: cytochrome d ubiquinol oxidase subunit II [Chlamydiia bacterium]
MIEYLEIIWYLIICIGVVMYILLDGFDLGVGSLMFLGKSDEERRVMLNSIGPLWDGNEVWLIIVGGGLFAGFPAAYAAICSCYYTPVMFLLFGIILRAVGIEFRSKVESHRWRVTWDAIFGIASMIITLGVGLVLGSLVVGIPFTREGSEVLFLGDISSFFTPFTLNIALMALLLFAIHGGVFLLIKTEGALHARVKKTLPLLMIFFLVAFFVSSITMRMDVPQMFQRFDEYKFLYLIALLVPGFIALCYVMIKKGRDGWAFICSCGSIATLFTLSGIGFAPNILRSTLDPSYSITLYNSGVTKTTYIVILIIAGIGLPFVFAYGIWLYKTFSGKTKLHATSY